MSRMHAVELVFAIGWAAFWDRPCHSFEHEKFTRHLECTRIPTNRVTFS